MGTEGMAPELLDDDTPWTLVDVARELGVARSTVYVWRMGNRRGLPDPDAAPLTHRYPHQPRWRAGTVRRWAVATGRMTKAGVVVSLRPEVQAATRRSGAGFTREVVEPDAHRWALPQIAEFLAVPLEQVREMRAGGELPEPDLVAAHRPLWNAQAIREWAAGR